MTREFTLKFEVSKANIGDSSIFFSQKALNPFTTRDHPLNTKAKLSEKLLFFTPWYAHEHVGIRGWEILVSQRYWLMY